MYEVIEGQSIHFKNIMFKSYSIKPSDEVFAVDDFKALVERCQVTLTGEMIVAIVNPLEESECVFTIYAPIKEDSIPEGIDDLLCFQTYFSVNNLIKFRLLGEFEKLSEVAYKSLILHAVENDMKMCTPFFSVLNKFAGRKYMDICVGIDPNEKYHFKAKQGEGSC